MTQPLQPQVRKTALASANFQIVRAGLALVGGGMPKDAEELKLLKEVLRLLRLRAEAPPAEQTGNGTLEGAAAVGTAGVPPPSPK